MSEDIKEYINPGKKNLILIYVLYLGGMLIHMLPIIGAAFAFVNMNHKDILWRSHYIFAFRTFCFGVLMALVAFITTVIFIGPVLYFLFFFWCVVRSIIALQYLLEETPHPNPKTLWIK